MHIKQRYFTLKKPLVIFNKLNVADGERKKLHYKPIIYTVKLITCRFQFNEIIQLLNFTYIWTEHKTILFLFLIKTKHLFKYKANKITLMIVGEDLFFILCIWIKELHSSTRISDIISRNTLNKCYKRHIRWFKNSYALRQTHFFEFCVRVNIDFRLITMFESQ